MKYIGSKNKLSKELVPIIQSVIDKNSIETYIEPFVGGANVIDKIRCKNKIGYDKNEYLISLLNAIKNGYIPPSDFTKEQYLEIKNNMTKYPKELVGVAGFCATYNGGWMRRWGGTATTKDGKIRNYYKEGVSNLLKQKENLMDIEFRCSDFKNINYELNNCVIYCDAPYKDSKYEMYQQPFDYDSYYRWVKKLAKNNIVFCSEYNMPDDFECIWSKDVRMSLDKNNSKQVKVEKLYTYKVK